MERNYDVAVIGGGASGMAASIRAAEKGKRVLLIEKSNRCGRKILASGNGRCNLMNKGSLVYYGDETFALKVLAKLSRNQITAFFRKYGLIMTEESDGRIYPLTYQASTVLSVLKNAASMNRVTVILNDPVISVYKDNLLFTIQNQSGSIYHCQNVIIACGGAVQPKLGGSTDGYQILKSLGHTIVPVSPALVPLVTDSRSISGLSGSRIRCKVDLFQHDCLIHTEEGEVLFTDYGISGICIMQCARFIKEEGNCYLYLNLLSGIPDKRDILSELHRRKRLFSSCSPIWLLNGMLSEKLSYAVLKQAGVQLQGETAGEISDKQLEHILECACAYRIIILGKRGMDQAQITSGGADCSEFSPSTMESRILPGLYAVGEVLNVDGDCGGFNLMFAFASGLLAGSSV